MQALQRLLAAAPQRQQVAVVTPGDPGGPQQPLATSPLTQLCQPTRPKPGTATQGPESRWAEASPPPLSPLRGPAPRVPSPLPHSANTMPTPQDS